jgi:anti-sigma regulatory factor (Ser/Thr protein kinase)
MRTRTVSGIVHLGNCTNMGADRACRAFAPEAAAIAAVRRFVAEVAAPCGCDVGMAVLIASELATNAVLHARSAFTVQVWPDGDGITIEVRDDNPRLPAPGSAGPRDLSGRGLQLVAALAQSWGIHPDHDGKSVWAHF